MRSATLYSQSKTNIMSRIKIEFERLPVLAQVSKSRDIQTKMGGNIVYGTPVPSLAEVKAATDKLELLYNQALNKDMEKKANVRIQRKVLKGLITELADYIQITSRGDAIKILSSGFDVRRGRTPVGIPGIPERLKLKAATIEGELEITWKAVKGAKSYIVEYALNSEFAQIVGSRVVTRARFKATKLAEGVKYWFRVQAVNAAGYSGWSMEVAARTL